MNKKWTVNLRIDCNVSIHLKTVLNRMFPGIVKSLRLLMLLAP